MDKLKESAKKAASGLAELIARIIMAAFWFMIALSYLLITSLFFLFPVVFAILAVVTGLALIGSL